MGYVPVAAGVNVDVNVADAVLITVAPAAGVGVLVTPVADAVNVDPAATNGTLTPNALLYDDGVVVTVRVPGVPKTCEYKTDDSWNEPAEATVTTLVMPVGIVVHETTPPPAWNVPALTSRRSPVEPTLGTVAVVPGAAPTTDENVGVPASWMVTTMPVMSLLTPEPSPS